jgi:hypothetical protein
MASHYKDNLLHGRDHTDDHASDNRWRHQESGSFRRHASNSGAREADARHGSKDLADFFNTARIEPPGSAGEGAATKYQPIMVAGNAYNGHSTGQGIATQHDGAPAGEGTTGTSNTLEVKCGPLLNYRRMENEHWFGSVLVVTKGGGLTEGPVVPELTLRIVGNVHPAGATSTQAQPLEGSTNGAGKEPYGVVNGVDYGTRDAGTSSSQIPTNGTNGEAATIDVGKESWEAKIQGTKLYSDPMNTFWRFSLEVPMRQAEIQCEYTISGLEFTHGKKTDKQQFYIPAISESMRIMFHSCNGFSVGTDEAAWSGAALWNDVIRVHKKTPFHVMYVNYHIFLEDRN